MFVCVNVTLGSCGHTFTQEYLFVWKDFKSCLYVPIGWFPF